MTSLAGYRFNGTAKKREKTMSNFPMEIAMVCIEANTIALIGLSEECSAKRRYPAMPTRI